MTSTPTTVTEALIMNKTGATGTGTLTLPNSNGLVIYATGPDHRIVFKGQQFDEIGRKVGGEITFAFKDQPTTKEFDVVVLTNGNVVITTESKDDIEFRPLVGVFDVTTAGGTVSPLRENHTDAVGANFFDTAITGLGDGFIVHTLASAFGIKNLKAEENSNDTVKNVRSFSGNDDATIDSTTLANGKVVLALDRDGRQDSNGEINILLLDEKRNLDREVKIGNTQDNNFDVTVEALAGGGFVVAWAETDDNDTDIVMQVFDAAGNTVAAAREVGFQDTARANNNEPSIVALDDGGFILFYDKDAGTPEIRGQRFDARGNEVGEDFQVAAENGSQISATTLEFGRIAVSFQSTNPATGQLVAKTEILTVVNEIKGGRADRNDVLVGTDDVDRIDGFGGNDRLDGGKGDDFLFGGDGNDVLLGRAGNDRMFGGAGGDRMLGQGGDDLLSGGGGSDTLFGGGGNDVLDGGADEDVLSGDAGNDVLSGGAGADTFVFRASFGTDIVTDFDIALPGIAGSVGFDGGAGAGTQAVFESGDVIDLSAQGIAGFGELSLRQSGDDAVIDLSNGSIVLEGIDVADLTANHFLF